MTTVCGGMKNRMTQKEKAEMIRTMARGCNISPLLQKRIQEGTTRSLMRMFGKCKKPEDIEARCREIQAVCEENREMLERIGFKLEF